ncbi:hypothetical protein HWV62_24266 [Athelia sp. TMB]|nr:hypothetical protein HWV62_24266 [Athelia sp. TMB]
MCLSGTRVSLLSAIGAWARLRDSQSIFWLNGVAGSGKSAIAHTVARSLREAGFLISAFFFSRDAASRNNPRFIFSTIARDLANLHSGIAEEIATALEKEPALPSASLSRQFDAFILKPSSHHSSDQPIVVVIDALDESIQNDRDTTLLAILRDETKKLPANFRILVTSRPTIEIEQFLSENAHIKSYSLDIYSSENKQDITKYVDAQLCSDMIRSNVGTDWPGEEAIRELERLSGGLFIWIATICVYLRTVYNPRKKLRALLSHPSQESFTTDKKMDNLYTTVLAACGDWDDADFLDDYDIVMGAIMAAKRPLSLTALQALHESIQYLSPQDLLKKFGSVLVGFRDPSEPIRILHLSFREFVTDRAANVEGTRKFYISEASHSSRLAETCLKFLNSELRNTAVISGIGYLSQPSELLGIPEISGVSERTLYCCEHWIDHLVDVKEPRKIYQQKNAPELTHLYDDKSQGLLLCSLAKRLSHSRRLEEASLAIQESVELRRAVVKEQPADLELKVELAASLNDLSHCFTELGLRMKAQAAFEEAADITQPPQLQSRPQSPMPQNRQGDDVRQPTYREAHACGQHDEATVLIPGFNHGSSAPPLASSEREAFAIRTPVMSESRSFLLTIQGIDHLMWTSTAYAKLRAKLLPNLYIEVYIDQTLITRTTVVKSNSRPIWGETLSIASAQESSKLTLKLKHKSPLLSDPCFGIANETVGRLLRLSEGQNIPQLKLEQSPQKSMSNAQGILFARIEATAATQARDKARPSKLAFERPQPSDSDISEGAGYSARGALAHPAVAGGFSVGEIKLKASQAHIHSAAKYESATSEGLELHLAVESELPRELGVPASNVDPSTATNSDDAGETSARTSQDDVELHHIGYNDSVVTIPLIMETPTADASQHTDVLVSLEAVLDKIRRIPGGTTAVVDTLAEAFTPQNASDAPVLNLFEQIMDVYFLVSDYESLPNKTQHLDRIAMRCSQQIIECMVFIRDYTGRGSTDKSEILKTLDPARMNAANRPMCPPGTRKDLLKIITEWLCTPTEENILWLHGAAGSGKSTLATTVAEYFRRLHRRGAFLFFDRTSPIESDPSRVISTLAYQLAKHNDDVSVAIIDAIKGDFELVSAPLASQFTSLLFEPLSKVSFQINGPIIIVLDALDECGDPSSRWTLLNILNSHEFASLPRQFRFFITSRPDHDITAYLSSRSHVFSIDLATASNEVDHQENFEVVAESC